MIPVKPIAARQHGQARSYSSPSINLGSSLSRVSVGRKLARSVAPKPPTVTVATVSRRIITARRISDLFLSLPKIAESRRSTLRTKKESLQGTQSRQGAQTRRSVTLSRDDLRRRRLQLQENSFKKRVSHRSSSQTSKRFHKIANTVRLIVRINFSLKAYLLEDSNPNWSLQEMTLSLKEYFDRILSCRPRDRWKTHSYNGRLATVLTVPPKLRSAEHLRTIKALLRGHTAFEEYPDHVQEQLCQSVVYQRYEARRVVTRFGHIATTFYLILSGTVLVNIPETDENNEQLFMKTVNELGPGEAFGEIGLITGERRSATIICKTDIEVLVIDKEAFDVIIKWPLETQLNHHVDYIRSLELFRHFPCNVFVNNSNNFFYQYFQPNVLILSNSVESSFLVVVLSGKCLAVSSYAPQNKLVKYKDQQLTKQLKRSFPLYSDRLEREEKTMTQRDIRDIANTAALEFSIKSKPGGTTGFSLQEFNQQVLDGQTGGKKRRGRRRSSLTEFYDVKETEQKLSSQMHPEFWSHTLSSSTTKTSLPQLSENPSKELRARRRSRFHKDPPLLKRRASQGELVEGTVRTWRRVAALVGAQKANERKDMTSLPATFTKYAQLAEFSEGKVFGLETLLQKDSSSAISLVSSGCECLFISKQVFLEHASAKVLRVVSDLIVTYPSKEFIGAYIKRQKKWKEYKSKLIQDHSKFTIQK